MKRDVACILLFDSQERILLQHRDEDCRRLPGHWAFFGGGIEENETAETAVRREALEELECTLREPVLFHTQSTPGGTKYFFLERCSQKNGLVLHEGQGWGWFSLLESEELKMSEGDREVLRFLAARNVLSQRLA